jgi:hypothetical protein
MANCDLGFEHDDVPVTEPEPDPVIVEPGPNENDVKIAEIEAGASIEREKIYTEQRGLELEGEVQRLRGEIEGMRTVLETIARPEPEPEPEPVVIPVPDAGPPPDGPPPPPDNPPASGSKKKDGYWGNYR